MKQWQEMKFEGIARIERVTLRSHATVIGRFPGPSVAVTVVEEANGTYRGMTDTAALDTETGDPLWVEGRGATALEALETTVRLFMESTHGRRLTHEDVAWKDPRGF